jgi:phosphoenolpyruvate synthase/pyruvate phosphate dikinase
MGHIVDVSRQKPPVSVGNKAFNIRKLTNIGIRIPKTYAVKWDAYHRYSKDDTSLIEELKMELARIVETGKSYAVRSSANIEDSMDRSFAGQFKSMLHMQGVDEILQAVWAVWSSAQTPAVKTYLEKHNVPTQELSMGVIIQEMVKPVYSGVAHPVLPKSV